MRKEQPEELVEKRARFEALRAAQNAKDFVAYWQKEGGTARDLAKKVKEVITGVTPVTEEVIAECKAARLRLNQIAYVLGELSCYLGGSNSLAVAAAMEIVSEHQRMAHDAAKHICTMVAWTTIPGVSPTPTMEQVA